MDLTNFVSFGTSPATYVDSKNGQLATYNISSPTNSSGKVKGIELGWQQPIWGGFGAIANYTYADGEETGGKELVGTSKNTYNLVGYFENDRFNVRLAYNYRSAFFNGLDRSTAQHQDDTGTLAASIGYRINDTFSVSLDGQNLNDPLLKYYADNKDQPTAFYKNGRQYFLMLRAKM
jgi:iron complex outermembrane receptor protein